MTSLSAGDCGRYEHSGVRPPPGVPVPRAGGPAGSYSRRGRRPLGNSLAVLLRVPERSDEPQNLEGHRLHSRTSMAPARRVDGFTLPAPHWGDQGLSRDAGALRARPASAWRCRPRCEDRGNLRGPRGGGAAHPRPGLRPVPRVAHARSSGGNVPAQAIGASDSRRKLEASCETYEERAARRNHGKGDGETDDRHEHPLFHEVLARLRRPQVADLAEGVGPPRLIGVSVKHEA